MFLVDDHTLQTTTGTGQSYTSYLFMRTWIWQKSLKQSKPIFFYDKLAKACFVVAGVVRRNSGVTGTLHDLVSHFQFWIFVTFLKEII